LIFVFKYSSKTLTPIFFYKSTANQKIGFEPFGKNIPNKAHDFNRG